MQQALIKNGKIQSVEVPNPGVTPGSVLIKTVYSCISAGTEGSVIASSKPKSLIRAALEQPEKVEKAWQLLKEKGLSSTINKVRQVREGDKKNRQYPKPTGYSIAGMVTAVGPGVDGFKIGDRVAASGAGIACHAEYVNVPINLITRIPENLDYRAASTVTLGGIAMQGVRRAAPRIGEFVVVYGTGILGLITLQLVKTAGGRCLAVDLDQSRLSIAAECGAELTLTPDEAEQKIFHYTGGHGADTVIFAAATSNPAALSQALKITRKKGRLVMVGVYGDKVNRQDLYEKEIDFLISTSYGPGRYDPIYEEKGLDYPYAYVRWTENRNLQEYLRLLATGAIRITPMIGKTFPIRQVDQAFAELEKPDRPLLLFLHYGDPAPKAQGENYRPGRNQIEFQTRKAVSDRIRVGVIGAGNFAVNTHLPNLQKLSNLYQIRAICSKTGSKAKTIAERFGAAYATTDYHEILDDPDIDLTMICTRHNLHGRMALESLQAGKHTFVEKPLCTTWEELEAIKEFYGLADAQDQQDTSRSSAEEEKPLLMIGFNRRYSKYAREIKKHTDKRVNPLVLHYRMNAGYIPLDHWVHTEEGGGRIIGEACHIIDLFSYIVGHPVKAFSCATLQPNTDSISGSDNKIITLEYEDGSIGTIHYFVVGSRELGKEWMEVHFDEKTIFMDDYKSLVAHGVNIDKIQSEKPDKGQYEELDQLFKIVMYKQFASNHLTEVFNITALTLSM